MGRAAGRVGGSTRRGQRAAGAFRGRDCKAVRRRRAFGCAGAGDGRTHGRSRLLPAILGGTRRASRDRRRRPRDRRRARASRTLRRDGRADTRRAERPLPGGRQRHRAGHAGGRRLRLARRDRQQAEPARDDPPHRGAIDPASLDGRLVEAESALGTGDLGRAIAIVEALLPGDAEAGMALPWLLDARARAESDAALAALSAIVHARIGARWAAAGDAQ